MAKKFSKEELAAKASEIFKSHPAEDVLYATEDGQFFLKKNKGLADDHNRKVVKGEVAEIKKPAAKEAKPAKPAKAAEGDAKTE